MTLDKLWYGKKGFLNYLLLPLSFIFRLAVFLRRCFLLRFFYDKHDFNLPVIVVGNLTAGGVGKTPFVIWLSEFLKKKGYSPGIVSRGYGGKSDHYPLEVKAESAPFIAGDEAVLLAKRTQCPVVAAPSRVEAVKYLLNNHPACNIIISDDGLQHYYLKRDIEIVIVDGERGFGNEWPLPAGPLREPLLRLKKVDFIVIHAPNAGHNAHNMNNNKIPCNTTYNTKIFDRLFEDQIVYPMTLIPGDFYNLCSPDLKSCPEDFEGQVLHAAAGIGNPGRFFNLLRQLGLNIFPHVFPDHHIFKLKDFEFDKENKILMTEKDAVKCKDFADYRYWCLPVSASVGGNLGSHILKKIQ